MKVVVNRQVAFQMGAYKSVAEAQAGEDFKKLEASADQFVKALKDTAPASSSGQIVGDIRVNGQNFRGLCQLDGDKVRLLDVEGADRNHFVVKDDGQQKTFEHSYHSSTSYGERGCPRRDGRTEHFKTTSAIIENGNVLYQEAYESRY